MDIMLRWEAIGYRYDLYNGERRWLSAVPSEALIAAVDGPDFLTADLSGVGLSEEDLTRINAYRVAEVQALRRAAYASESDPIDYKERRGEVPAGTWAAKCAEIQARYPYPEGSR